MSSAIHSDLNDQELLVLLKNKDENALSVIIDRYWESLFTKANNFLRNPDVAKDCVQDVFISIWKQQAENIENLDHYLHQAVRFRALRAIRNQKSNEELEKRLISFHQDILSSESLEYKELKNAIYKLINALPEDQRIIFLLNREEGLTYKEIAARLNISVKTVEKKMSRSIKTLRTGLDEVLCLLVIGEVAFG